MKNSLEAARGPVEIGAACNRSRCQVERGYEVAHRPLAIGAQRRVAGDDAGRTGRS